MSEHCIPNTTDVFIIGGGIAGLACAAEAASRGCSVVLCEAEDLASGASSHTSCLLSGDLRALEQMELDGVKQALNEQACLWRKAPHLITPSLISIPNNPSIRSRRRVRWGLSMYRLMQDNELLGCVPTSSTQENSDDNIYVDCIVQDHRLALATAISAADLGAHIATRHTVTRAHRADGHWQIHVESGSRYYHLTANVLVNASGADMNHCLNKVIENDSRCQAKRIREDHIIIKRPTGLLSESTTKITEKISTVERLQHPNKQLINVTPYGNQHYLIGPYASVDQQTVADDAPTTPKVQGLEPLNTATIELIELFNHYHPHTPITTADVVKQQTAYRIHCNDMSSHQHTDSQRYILDLDCPQGHSPLLNIFSGQLTTHRLLAEQALDILKPYTGASRNPSFKTLALPGGDMNGCMNDFEAELQLAYPSLNPALLSRYAHTYGTLSYRLLEGVNSVRDMGRYFGGSLYSREVRYLCEHEWAESAEDILWRRTKLGLTMPKEAIEDLQMFLQ